MTQAGLPVSVVLVGRSRERRGPSVRGLVVENSPGSPVGQLGPWLEADGVAVDLHRGREGLPDSLDGYYGLIRLGGSAARPFAGQIQARVDIAG